MSTQNEEKKTKEEAEFLDTYTQRYKDDLGISIREYTKEELLNANPIKEEVVEKKSFFQKILKFLCLKK